MDAKLKETILNPIFKGNPITVLVLGICSSLAVTVTLKGALVMALSVIAVCGISSLILSLLRNTIPGRVRIIVQLVVVAMMVILVDQILKSFEATYAIDKQLSVYIGLIITNCIVMGRIEAFALGNKPWPAAGKRHPFRCRYPGPPGLRDQQPRYPAPVRPHPAGMHRLGAAFHPERPSGKIKDTPYGIS